MLAQYNRFVIYFKKTSIGELVVWGVKIRSKSEDLVIMLFLWETRASTINFWEKYFRVLNQL